MMTLSVVTVSMLLVESAVCQLNFGGNQQVMMIIVMMMIVMMMMIMMMSQATRNFPSTSRGSSVSSAGVSREFNPGVKGVQGVKEFTHTV